LDNFDVPGVVGEAVSAREERSCVQSFQAPRSGVLTNGAWLLLQDVVNVLQPPHMHQRNYRYV